jgi:gliding motility-associated-like protein
LFEFINFCSHNDFFIKRVAISLFNSPKSKQLHIFSTAYIKIHVAFVFAAINPKLSSLMLKCLAYTLGVFLTMPFIRAQQNACPNVDVSQGNFTNWNGYTGSYYSPGTTFGIVNGRHTVISQQGTDPNTCNQLSLIPSGHTKSIKLGNPSSGAQSERLVYSIQVTPQSSLFIYKYAVVLENPGHIPAQQPKFETKILNALGMPIGGGCGTYTVYGGQPGQNFQQCAGKTWLPWTTVGLDLTPYMGQTIQVEFTTWDCAQGAHFGYAYLAAECLPLSIDVNYCGGNQPLILTAPTGFQSYVWHPGNLSGQQVTINNPIQNQTYTCTMTTYSNQGTCAVELSVQASPTHVNSNFVYTAGCENEPITFQATSTVSTNTPNVSLSYQWNFGNANPVAASGSTPNTFFNNPGSQLVELITSSSNGCSDTIQQQVNILPTPHITPSVDATCIQQQTSFTLLGNPNVQQVTWDFGDNSTIATGILVTHQYSTPGNYSIEVIGMGLNGCQDTVSMPLTIQPLPYLHAGNDTAICPGLGLILNAQGALNVTWDQGLVQGQIHIPSQQEYLSVIGIDSLHCIVSDSFLVQIHLIDSVQAMPPSSLCAGDSIQLAAVAFTGIWWENGYIHQEWITEPVGIHQFVVHGLDANGCASSDTTQIEVYPLPHVVAGNDTTICSGSTLLLQASGAIQYQWSNQVINGSTISVYSNQELTVLGINEHGCQAIDSIHIGIDSIPNLAFSIAPYHGCIPVEINLQNQSSGNSFTQVQWLSSNGAIAFGDSAQLLFTEVGCFDLTQTVTTVLGCTYSTTQSNVICTNPLPTSQFSLPQTPLSTMNYGGNFTNLSSGAGGYLWDFGDGSEPSNEEQPYHNFPDQQAASYQVMLIAYNEFGCSDTSYQIIQISEELAFYVPNSFTPDGNQFNNVWQPVFTEGLNPQAYHAAIYNRWGEIIWESYDAAVGWDGTYGMNGIEVQDDVYIYNITFGYKDSAKKERITGHIVLIK